MLGVLMWRDQCDSFTIIPDLTVELNYLATFSSQIHRYGQTQTVLVYDSLVYLLEFIDCIKV
jgi:hypothetical protein